MADKLKVHELPVESSKHDLSTTGPKYTLDKRLKSHLNEQNISSVDASVGEKRQRDCRFNDPNESEKIRAVEVLQQMDILQCQQAVLKGISANWSKKEFLTDLRNNLKSYSEYEDKGEEDVDIKGKKQVITDTEYSEALDQYLPDHIKAEYHVLEHEDEIYNAILNQTNLGDNINKFYVIQALESNDGSKFMVYSRWGRVGIKGQFKLKGPYSSRNLALYKFQEKFFAKTKNHWLKRKEFRYYPKYYTWLELDHNADKESEVQDMPNPVTKIQLSKLDPRTANFISLIRNINMMKQKIMGLGYNAKMLPLSKLSRSTILKGCDILRRIADVIDQSDSETLEQLSGEFYTLIPHDFGFHKMSGFTIDNPYKLKCKLEMVEALGEIKVATSLMKDIYAKEDPLYSWYQCLQCELEPIEAESKEFSMIKTYIQNTGTELYYKPDIFQIFRASRQGESERFEKFSGTKNRMLLWHGSRLTNWAGILSQGLRIAPPEAPVSGCDFGKGIYFADMFSRSVGYCGANSKSPDAVLLLCEVALGDMNELLTLDCNADKLPKGKLSTKGVGKIAPDLSEAQVLEDGVIVPLGLPKEQSYPMVACRHNEYIVYNVEQIRMRYVVHVNFSFTQ